MTLGEFPLVEAVGQKTGHLLNIPDMGGLGEEVVQSLSGLEQGLHDGFAQFMRHRASSPKQSVPNQGRNPAVPVWSGRPTPSL
ncbi:MAG: hypothetical protein IPJ33_07970 [Gammaproteobacteria bacterium]|nr:hypothetical protein [Gammaproteobacteria bacterium]MBK7728414.1 hypothetical protein [Gammaproteobacteria bacterium]